MNFKSIHWIESLKSSFLIVTESKFFPIGTMYYHHVFLSKFKKNIDKPSHHISPNLAQHRPVIDARACLSRDLDARECNRYVGYCFLFTFLFHNG